jgi:hypothetical protein
MLNVICPIESDEDASCTISSLSWELDYLLGTYSSLVRSCSESFMYLSVHSFAHTHTRSRFPSYKHPTNLQRKWPRFVSSTIYGILIVIAQVSSLHNSYICSANMMPCTLYQTKMHSNQLPLPWIGPLNFRSR